MSRKRCKRKVYALVNPVAYAIEGATVTAPRDLDKLRLLELSALECFRMGHATREEWRQLADMVNLCEVLAAEFKVGGTDALQAAQSAQQALIRSHARASEGKPLLLDGEGLEALRDCYAWHDAQRSSVARSLYEKAIQRTAAKVRNRAPGVEVVG